MIYKKCVYLVEETNKIKILIKKKTKKAIRDRIGKIIGYFVHLSSNKMKKLKSHSDMHNSVLFDGIFRSLFNFSGRNAFLEELLHTFSNLQEICQDSWPAWPKTYVSDPVGGWDGINASKIKILKLLVERFKSFYKLSINDFSLLDLGRILEFLEGVLSNLQELLGVNEGDVDSVHSDNDDDGGGGDDGDDGTRPSTSGTGIGPRPAKIRKVE